jgi:hypothetical protein
LNEPGTYTIIAKRNMVSPETGKVFVVVSNQLKVSTDTPIIAPAVPMKN